MIEGHLIELRRAAKLEKARFSVRHIDQKKMDRDAAATVDEWIMRLEDSIAKEEAKLKLLDGVIAAYTKIVEGASREITRRSEERASRGD